MKKTNEKKINWKNVAIIGGVFVLGVVAGFSGRKGGNPKNARLRNSSFGCPKMQTMGQRRH